MCFSWLSDHLWVQVIAVHLVPNVLENSSFEELFVKLQKLFPILLENARIIWKSTNFLCFSPFKYFFQLRPSSSKFFCTPTWYSQWTPLFSSGDGFGNQSQLMVHLFTLANVLVRIRYKNKRLFLSFCVFTTMSHVPSSMCNLLNKRHFLQFDVVIGPIPRNNRTAGFHTFRRNQSVPTHVSQIQSVPAHVSRTSSLFLLWSYLSSFTQV